MSYQDCLAEIRKAAGRALSNDELDDLLTELQKRLARVRLLNRSGDLDAEVMQAADDYARDMAAAATIEKRNAAINLKRRLEAVDFVSSQFDADPALGLEALLVGVNRARKGSRRSAAAEQNALRDRYIAGFIADVEKGGNWQVFVSGALDRDIARAMWAKNRAEPVAADVPREAAAIADAVIKWQEVARYDANRAGAWVKKLDGYIVRQSHDLYRIRAAGFDRWKADILPLLDADRTFDGDDPDAVLKGAYEGLASGVHLRTRDERPSGLTGPRNIARKLSEDRVLHFRNADAWFDYDQTYGSGSLREAIFRGLEWNAQTTGLMRRLGTNPEANLAQIADDLMRRIDDPLKRQAFQTALNGHLRSQLREVDGSTRIPVHAMRARIASNVRVGQRLSKLGAAVLSQAGDIPLYASEMRYQGRSFFGGIAESIGNIFQGRGNHERREIGGMIGVYADTMKGDAAVRASIADDDLPGIMSRAQQIFFKWNLMTPWSDRMRAGAVFAFSHRLALNRGLAFDALEPDLQRTLRLFAIDEPEWEIIRSATTREADGRDYVIPEAITELPDDAFTALLAGQGVKPTASRIRDLKEEIADKLRTYYSDRAGFATIMPDARTRATWQRGTQPGTVVGEFLRFIAEFKAFPTAVIQKVLGREIYGRGADTFGEALRNGNGEMLGLAHVILATTAFGYLSMSLKDLAKGRAPRQPDDHKTWMAAFVQGGGAGIYGDFLFGEGVKNRFGGGLASTALGPTIGTVEDIADLWGRLRDGDDLAAATFRTALSNTPGANLFYTRLALDYLILWHIQEALNPGALSRLERRIEKENGQTFLVRPSAVVN